MRDGASLVAADIASGLPARQTAVEWGSLTVPGFSMVAMLPGALADEAAVIDVPVEFIAHVTRVTAANDDATSAHAASALVAEADGNRTR